MDAVTCVGKGEGFGESAGCCWFKQDRNPCPGLLGVVFSASYMLPHHIANDTLCRCLSNSTRDSMFKNNQLLPGSQSCIDTVLKKQIIVHYSGASVLEASSFVSDAATQDENGGSPFF